MNNNTYTLGYTNAHQLASEALSNTSLFDFGPPTTVTGTASYTVNTLNQYPSVTPMGGSQASLTYDPDGNLTYDGNFTYTYDPLNRMVSATNGTISATYAYDPLGARETKTVGSTVTTFIQDEGDDIAEYDSSGDVLRRFIPGPSMNDPIAFEICPGTSNPTCTTITSTEYFHNDHHGSVVAMTDSSGNPAAAENSGNPFKYDSYGNMPVGTSTGGVPFRFVGMYYDAETGLYYDRARYYSPALGRFLQTDSIGYKDDIDWYTYVGNDPTNQTDPTGNCPWCLGAAIGGGLELGLQLATPQGRAAYAAAASAIARGDVAGAVRAAGANVAKVALSAAAGAAGVGIAAKVAEVANIASKAAEVGGVGKVLVNAAVNASGNAAAGAGLGAASQAGGNIASGQPVSSGTGGAALYGAAGGAGGSLITGSVSGETQNLATATGEMVAGHAGVAAPGVTSAAAERAGAIGGPAIEKALSACGGPSAQSGSATCH